MTMKVTVGISRKVGQPNYGSTGASCHIDVELDQSLLIGDRRQLQQRLQQALDVCRGIVEGELAGGQSHPSDSNHQPSRPTSNPPAGGQSPGGQTAAHRSGSQPRPATAAQVKALHAIAGKAGLVLASELERQFGVRLPQQLTLSQASEMIDRLKAAAAQPA